MSTFSDFNFKLAVINKLMYEEETLLPKFDVATHLDVADPWKHAVDREDGAAEMVPECRTYFEELVISAELLASIEEIEFEGGAEIYQHVAPSWDGTDELFDVETFADAALLPNLKRVIGELGALLPDDAEDQANDLGIVVEEPA